jgi:hypothetical protein
MASLSQATKSGCSGLDDKDANTGERQTKGEGGMPAAIADVEAYA